MKPREYDRQECADISAQIRFFGLAIKREASNQEQSARARMLADALCATRDAFPKQIWTRLVRRYTAAFGAPNHKIPVWEWAVHLYTVEPLLYREPLPPVCACDAEPGTEAKMQAFERRVAAGRGLYHDQDCPPNPEDRGARTPVGDKLRGRNGILIPGGDRLTLTGEGGVV